MKLPLPRADSTRRVHNKGNDGRRWSRLPGVKGGENDTYHPHLARDLGYDRRPGVQIPTKSPADSEMMSPGDTR